MTAYEKVFSDFEVRETSIKFDGATDFLKDDCVGTMELEETVRKITKKCRGTVVKNIIKHDGVITITMSLHVTWPVYLKMYGMDSTGLKAGIYAMNRFNSVRPSMLIVNHVYDEDGNEKFLAFPNCKATGALKEKIDNGASEVAETEVEITATVDDAGTSMYEALAAELTDETVKTTWMTAWNATLVKAAA